MIHKKILRGWGNNFVVDSNIFYPINEEDIIKYFNKKNETSITHALGRSYGDSSLNNNVINLKNFEKKINFNEQDGVIECSSNFSINEILKIIIKKGWFLNVTPGSKYITIGGAIAADVHGKNHHKDGSFCDHIISLNIITPNGQNIKCDRENYSDLFYSTCSGMGLTGIIVSAEIRLLKIKSKYIDSKVIKTSNLKETLDCFNRYKNYKYIVAWIDTLAKNKSLGRSILYLGEHSTEGDLNYKEKKKLSIPSFFPSILLNYLTVWLFNLFFFHFNNNKIIKKQTIDEFFYPLDKLKKWNNLYGKKGFVQIQILVQDKEYNKAISEIIKFFQQKKQASFLSTLKEMGKGNSNLLSFPNKGITITLDIKMNNNLKFIHKELEKILVKYNCKIYLAKDSLMSAEFFEKSYKNLIEFKKIKKKYDIFNLINSYQFERLTK